MKTYLIVVVFTLIGSSVSAEDAIVPDGLLGQRHADCNFFGRDAICHLHWQFGLHAKLLKMAYEVALDEGDGTTVFRGRLALRQQQDASFQGYWTDSNGAMHPVHATWQDGVLTSHWGTPATERGRSRYELSPDGTLKVTDWVLDEAGWRRFQEVVYPAAENP